MWHVFVGGDTPDTFRWRLLCWNEYPALFDTPDLVSYAADDLAFQDGLG